MTKRTDDDAPCPCHEVEPHCAAYDLEQRLAAPQYALLERRDEDTIVCRHCGRAWTAEALLGGGIYGDTLWRVQAAAP